MEDTKITKAKSLNEIKICRPKPKRLYPNSKKCNLKSSLRSSISTVNSEINAQKSNGLETKIDLENISLEEINTDFCIFNQFLEEELCYNELYDILNNSNDDKSKKLKNKNFPRIKRCENPLKKELENLKSSYFDELIADLEYNENEIENENTKI